MSRGNTPAVLDLIRERERIKRMCIIEAKRRSSLRETTRQGGFGAALAQTWAPG